MNDRDAAAAAAAWVNALRHVRPRDLAWHLSAIESDAVLAEVLKAMGIKTAADLVRRAG